MENQRLNDLQECIQKLSSLDKEAIIDGISNHFLELELSEGSEFRINGNREGLIYLANAILKIASSDVLGSHFHIDETGMADKCDMPVVICLKSAEWDKKVEM